jgi:hypothetical protein
MGNSLCSHPALLMSAFGGIRIMSHAKHREKSYVRIKVVPKKFSVDSPREQKNSGYARRDRAIYVYVIRRERLKGRVEAVTITSPPSGTSSDTLFSRFGRVATSSCGGAWKYICFVGVDSEGFLIWLERHQDIATDTKLARTCLVFQPASR